MITFSCPNCDNHLKVGDELAGREGWCRQCKSILIVPRTVGEPARTLEGEERHAAVERLFKAAAAKAETYRGRAEYAELALLRYGGLETRFAELTSQYQAIETRLSEMNQQRMAAASAEDAVQAQNEAVNALDSAVSDLASTVDALNSRVGVLEERSRDAGEEGHKADERLQRVENLLNELMSRIEKIESQLEPAPKQQEEKPAEEINLLKKDLRTEHAARLRIEDILKSTAGKIAELESVRYPMALEPEVPPIPANTIEEGGDADGAGEPDPGQEAVLGAFLRFMEKTPPGEFPAD
jgi:predicted  nucleic acid-binding Zn-ribbon protein